jgi:hypothetical protein
MAYEIMRTDGDVVHLRITGVMKLADQRAVQNAGKKLIEQGVKPSLIVTLDKFRTGRRGWTGTMSALCSPKAKISPEWP